MELQNNIKRILNHFLILFGIVLANIINMTMTLKKTIFVLVAFSFLSSSCAGPATGLDNFSLGNSITGDEELGYNYNESDIDSINEEIDASSFGNGAADSVDVINTDAGYFGDEPTASLPVTLPKCEKSTEKEMQQISCDVDPEDMDALYCIRSPWGGTVIKKNFTLPDVDKKESLTVTNTLLRCELDRETGDYAWTKKQVTDFEVEIQFNDDMTVEYQDFLPNGKVEIDEELVDISFETPISITIKDKTTFETVKNGGFVLQENTLF